jgi:hypothetical protein
MSPQLSAAKDDRSQLFGDASSVAVAYLPREKVLLAGDVVIYPLPYTPGDGEATPCSLKDIPTRLPGPLYGLNIRVEVGNRQRIAIAPIREHELAFVVRAPEIIGPCRRGQAGAFGVIASTASASSHQAVSVQYCVLRADRGQLDVLVTTL